MSTQPVAGLTIDLSKIPEVADHPDAANAKIVKEEPHVNELDPKSRIGYHLARIVLAMISVFIIFLILYILLKSPSTQNQIDYKSLLNLPDSVLTKKLANIKAIETENKESHDFVIQISQMVLLNMLLPILTAILGYIFGSHSEAKG